jgi:hypothetical protein
MGSLHTDLLVRLDRGRQEADAALAGIDLLAVVHPDTGWTVKDLLAHIAVWEEEMTLGIEAFSQGGVHLLPREDILEPYNQRRQLEFAAMPVGEVIAYWRAVRERFSAAVQAVLVSQLDEPFPAPWNRLREYSAADFVFIALAHEQEHIEQIIALVKSGE